MSVDLRFRFETGAVTHQGCIRDYNEDRYLAAGENGVWLVADGMGGHYGGDYAAESVVDNVRTVQRVSSAHELQSRTIDRIQLANRLIQDRSISMDGVTIGATVAALMVYDAHYACVWCGDSRVYQLRDGRLTQLTRDHTEVQELLDRGVISPEQAENWPRKNVITRAVGVSPNAYLDSVYGSLKDRDTFLLCSDGLTGHVADHEMQRLMTGASPQLACDRMLQLTLDRGATDNVTIMVVRCTQKTVVGGNGSGAPRGTWPARGV